MYEVEIKLPIFRRSQTQKGLEALGFKPGSLVRESDLYYTSDFHDFMKTDEALRIRTTENLTARTQSSCLTYKGKKIDSVSMTRRELETGVSDGQIAGQILEALGYRHLCPVVKLRQVYQRDQIHACVDQVEGLGSFLELEILVADRADYAPSLRQLEDILLDLGESMEATTTRSYLSMLLAKKEK